MRLKQIRPVGQAAKTSPSHGENMGSIPVRVTSKKAHECALFFVSTIHFHNTPNFGIRLDDAGSEIVSAIRFLFEKVRKIFWKNS